MFYEKSVNTRGWKRLIEGIMQLLEMGTPPSAIVKKTDIDELEIGWIGNIVTIQYVDTKHHRKVNLLYNLQTHYVYLETGSEIPSKNWNRKIIQGVRRSLHIA